MEDLEVKLAVYEETWRKFVKTHECFMELTEPGFKRNGAQTMYDEEVCKENGIGRDCETNARRLWIKVH